MIHIQNGMLIDSKVQTSSRRTEEDRADQHVHRRDGGSGTDAAEHGPDRRRESRAAAARQRQCGAGRHPAGAGESRTTRMPPGHAIPARPPGVAEQPGQMAGIAGQPGVQGQPGIPGQPGVQGQPGIPDSRACRRAVTGYPGGSERRCRTSGVPWTAGYRRRTAGHRR